MFIVLPLFFSGRVMVVSLWESLAWSLVAFSLAASSIYVINDIVDENLDRLHPVKCRRPLASGLVTRQNALAVGVGCITLSLTTSWIFVSPMLTGVISVYYILNVAYCFKLKQVAVLDILIVSLGYVFRLFVGSIATGVMLSHWIVLMTYLLALFLALAKRRDDVLIYDQQGIKTRHNIRRYNLSFINHSMSTVAGVMLVCYVMYTVSPEVTQRLRTPYLYLTSLFVIGGVLRYMQITFVELRSGSPTYILLHDAFIQACVFGWILSFAIVIYL